ncbi:MAG: NADH-quinone oxidoreductase subunit J [Candidatus Zixiibacteriota bacterium]
MSEMLSQMFADLSAQPIFYLIAFVIIVSSLLVVSLRNIFHSALFLILCLFCVAGIYILLEAEFLAAVQVLLYVGAVSILIVFAIMLTSQLANKKIVQTNEMGLIGFFVSAGILMATLTAFPYTMWKFSDTPLTPENIFTIGQLLMTDFVLPFEVVSILLLAALIGAIVLARRERA